MTDISIELPHKKIIMGTKYYKAALNINLGKEKLHSANLYLLFNFLKNVESQSSRDKNSEGILLYPRVNKDLDLTYATENHIIKVCTVNLNMKWQSIEERSLQIVS